MCCISLVSHSMREDTTDHSAKAVSFRLAYLWCCISFSKWNLWLALNRIACIISPAALTSNSPFSPSHTHTHVQSSSRPCVRLLSHLSDRTPIEHRHTHPGVFLSLSIIMTDCIMLFLSLLFRIACLLTANSVAYTVYSLFFFFF